MLDMIERLLNEAELPGELSKLSMYGRSLEGLPGGQLLPTRKFHNERRRTLVLHHFILLQTLEIPVRTAEDSMSMFA